MARVAGHEKALERSLSGDKRSLMPTISTNCRRILDLGCGAGQVLVASKLAPSIEAFGVDPHPASLRLGRTWDARIGFVCSAGEQLPFADARFDFVFSRNALPYMHLPTVLTEIERILMPGGSVWMTLYPPSMVFTDFRASLAAREPRGIAFQSYRLANGLLYRATSKQVRFPAGKRRCESFQTRAGIARDLRGLGFTAIDIDRGDFFLVRATKPALT